MSYYNDCRVHQETGEIPSKRWERGIREGKGRLKPLDDTIDLNWVFSLHELRRVKKDGTISFNGKEYKVGRFSGEEVTVCLISDFPLMSINECPQLSTNESHGTFFLIFS